MLSNKTYVPVAAVIAVALKHGLVVGHNLAGWLKVHAPNDETRRLYPAKGKASCGAIHLSGWAGPKGLEGVVEIPEAKRPTKRVTHEVDMRSTRTQEQVLATFDALCAALAAPKAAPAPQTEEELAAAAAAAAASGI